MRIATVSEKRLKADYSQFYKVERLIINLRIYILFSADLMIVRLKGKDTGQLNP